MMKLCFNQSNYVIVRGGQLRNALPQEVVMADTMSSPEK